MTLSTWIDIAELTAFLQVVIIDITLAGDNAIVVGMAAAGLAPCDRRRAIFWGIAVATVLRIGFALVAARFLAIIGLTLAGGILLLWVAWKMLREVIAEAPRHCGSGEACGAGIPRKTICQALFQIAIADVSMSLDNVLAVAGTARNHLWVLVAGLALSVALMGAASTVILRLLTRFPSIVWLGLGIITYVSGHMIYDGWHQVHQYLGNLDTDAFLTSLSMR